MVFPLDAPTSVSVVGKELWLASMHYSPSAQQKTRALKASCSSRKLLTSPQQSYCYFADYFGHLIIG